MEVLTEMDEYFNAMSKINLDETVMPYVKGRLVESDTYNKVQKILNTPELEKAHMFCYDLDLENLEECEIAKINNLYKLGVDRGFIDDDLAYQDCDCTADDKCVAPVEEPVKENPRAKVPCFVAMYSAMKDGQIKTGEAYSRAISVEAAKADVKAQLSKFGYSNISILAIEATEEDACSCTVSEDSSKTKIGEDDLLKGGVHNGHLPEAESDVEENDILKNRPHNNHLPEAEDSEDDSASTEDDSSSEEDDSSAEDDGSTEEGASSDAEDDSSEDSDDGGTEDDASSGSEDDSEDDSAADDNAEDDEKAAGDDDSSDDSEETSGDEGSEEKTDAGADELDDNKKADLKDNYKKIFKNTMLKCKFEDKSFDDLTLKEKVKFFTEISKTWQEDYEPSAFMSDKEIDQLNKIVIKK